MAIIAEDDKTGQTSASVEIKRPKWDDMLKNYPGTIVQTTDLYDDIGGGLPDRLKADPINWENSCAIRMSKGLNYSGVVLPWALSKGGTVVGKDKYKYWIRVNDMKTYLGEKFGLKKDDIIEAAGGKSAVDEFKGKKGIIVFDVTGWSNATGHFTLWDGANLIYPGDPIHDNPSSSFYYFHMEYYEIGTGKTIKTVKVRLWELK